MPLAAPTPTYTTPELVAEAMDLPDPTNPMDTYKFSNISHPTYDEVCRRICGFEDQIDRRLMRSWRPHRVVEQVLDIPRYQHDEASWRSDYFLYGGYKIPLQMNILPWDPEKGDKLEIRMYNGNWRDISHQYKDGTLMSESFSFDHKGGVMYLRTYMRQPMYGAVRITYRYGGEEGCEVPYAIQRLCSLLTAKSILASQFWVVKVGTGKDINGVRNSMISLMDEEINSIISSYQRPAKVYSMLTR
jgi:hypothetical protein